MTAIEEKLLAIAAKSANLGPADVLDMVADSEWDWCDLDWGWYVRRDVRELWGVLPLDVRLAIFIQAEGEASSARLCR